MQTLNNIRTAFLDFFEQNEHKILPSSSLIPTSDPTLMFTNAGMVQFKNVFSGAEDLGVKRATTSQKCVRAGGKHNDLDNVGYTARHHTFFEMLGNFSFGDYFKEGAIEYAWKFLTETLLLPPEKLCVTVFHTDDEAFNLWKKISGFSEDKIIRIATNDNFWAMGDTGPCGPCSEIFYDHGEKIFGGMPGTPDADGDRFVEIWNLVFMQYEQLADKNGKKGERINLPKPCIDTGSGLERVAAIMQGVHDNYDVDLFKKIIAASQQISGNNDAAMNTSHRVIADHLRSCSFLLADGVMPSNEGRGYVLRRIMRRAMRHAHMLGCREPLMHRLVSILVGEMGKAYPELVRAEALIIESLNLEEERFKETLGRGLKLLEEELSTLKKGQNLSGEVAFKLYDTYGFPLDLTEDILRSEGLRVELESFHKAMEEQKNKARAAWAGSGEIATDEIWFMVQHEIGATEFLGYETTEATGQVVALIKDGKEVKNAKNGDEVFILTNKTPFYAESGGQAGDRGVLTSDGTEIIIEDTKKQLGCLHAHKGRVCNGSIAVGDLVKMQVDEKRRNSLRANHSATHLLHTALHKHLGNHVTQKGSLVENDYFRFDFNHTKGLSVAEIEAIENEVNSLIKQNGEVTTKIMTPDEAIKQGAMALFGEKYGNEVRVVAIGREPEKDYSVELCGGTHVKHTGDIGLFKITREGSVAYGIRRIEGKTGKAAEDFIKAQQKAKEEEEARKQATQMAKAEEARAVGNVREQFVNGIKSAEKIGDVIFYGFVQEGIHPKDLRGFVDDFKKQVETGIVVIVSDNEGKVAIVAGITDNLTDKIGAVDLVRCGSEVMGGKGGGGRPDFAQAGGSDVNKTAEALVTIRKVVWDKL